MATLLTLVVGIGVLAVGAGTAHAAPSDGTRDTTFAPTGISGYSVYASLLDAQGRLVVAGDFSAAEGVVRGHIARYRADGTLDTSFATGSGFSGHVSSLAIDSSGNILAGGNFTTYNGGTANRIARLTPTGALDGTFATGSGFNGLVNSLAIDTSGTIIVGGGFTTYNGGSANQIARLTPTGALDGTFTTGSGFNSSVSAMAVDVSGNIIVGGGFSQYTGVAVSGIIRLTPTGTRDTTFATGSGFSGVVLGVTIDSAGNVLVGGNFATYGGVTANGIARLTPTGVLDTTFATGSGFDDSVRTITVDNTGNVFAGGGFTTYRGSTASRLVRLTSPVTLSYDLNGGAGTTPATQTTTSGGTITVAAGTGFTRTGHTFTGWNTAANGSGTSLAAGATRTLTATTTAYAQWTPVPTNNPTPNNPTPTPTPVASTGSINLLGGTGSIAAHAPITITAAGLAPGSTYTVTMYSSPVVLTTGTAPTNGAVQTSATLPAHVPAGAHRLVLTATAADGTPLTAETAFTVDTSGTITTGAVLAATGNDDALPLTALGGVLLLAGTGAVLIGRRRQH